MKSPCSRDGSALDCALERMEREAPEQTRRARCALDVLLHGVRNSAWPDVAWLFSPLMPDGFPVEMTFSSLPEPVVRYASEVAGPEMPESDRLKEAFRLYHVLTSRRASAHAEQAMLAMQAGHELLYGAWFGGAHTESQERYKIYAEVPSGAHVDEFLPGIFSAGIPPLHCHPRPVMLGYQPDTDMREIYFRVSGLAPEDVGKLLSKAGLSHRYRETLELLQVTARRPQAVGSLRGFSLVFNGTSKSKAVSFFTEGLLLFGSDANARRSLLETAQARSWSLAGYEQVTQAHQNRNSVAGHQGVIAWIVSQDKPVELRISVRPPDPDL